MTTDANDSAATAAVNSADNFFAKAPIDYTWTNSYDLTINPSCAITEHRLCFEIPKMVSPNHIFLGEIDMLLNLRIVDKDGNPPEDVEVTVPATTEGGTPTKEKLTARVAPINFFPMTMFRESRLFLNDTEASSSENGSYPLRVYTQMILNPLLYNGWVEAYGGYNDDPDGFRLTGDKNYGFEVRRTLFTDPTTNQFLKTSISFLSHVFTDFEGCTLPLISGVGVRLEFALHEPSFYMLCYDENANERQFRLKIDSAKLIVPVKVMAPGLALDLEKRLTDTPLTYPLHRMEIKKITLPKNILSHTMDSLTQSAINPDRILILMVPDAVWQGTYDTNPLEFLATVTSGNATAKLERILLTLNGTPLDQYCSTNHDELLTMGFYRLYQRLGQLLSSDSGCGLTRDDFRGGFFMYMFDLTQSSRAFNTSARQPTKAGNLRLEVTFDEALPTSMNLFCINEYHASVSIDKNRNVTYSFVS